jgi:TatA/E family protein of Tat protein translocase
MFDGALSPWHVAIVVVVVFLIFGPKRIVNKAEHIGASLKRLAGDDDGLGEDTTPAQRVASRPERRGLLAAAAFRWGRWIAKVRRSRR